jgi:hypothetical protein
MLGYEQPPKKKRTRDYWALHFHARRNEKSFTMNIACLNSPEASMGFSIDDAHSICA